MTRRPTRTPRSPTRSPSAQADDAARFFATPAAGRRWLERNHDRSDALWVGFHKKASGRPSITWPEAVDGALCFGWIDGVRRSIDATRYRIRFTPRRPGSRWSLVNVRRVAALAEAGLMAPAGLRAFEARSAARTGTYAYEQREAAAFAPEEEKRLRADAAAWEFFSSRPPWYRRVATFWVVSAKRPETRARRLDALVADSSAGRRIAPLRRPER
ncbi:MAG: YdeI/OmpD-associated family protein [Anaeromyxobacteraceae bacterium]